MYKLTVTTANNQSRSTQFRYKTIKDDFQKKVRRQILESKFSQIRKKALINSKSIDQQNFNFDVSQQIFNFEIIQANPQNYLFEQFFKTENTIKISCQNSLSRTKTVQKSLQILNKFKNASFQNCIGTSEIKKLMNKTDAIICLVISINQWIIEDQAKTQIQKQFRLKSKNQLQDLQLFTQKVRQNHQQIQFQSQILSTRKPNPLIQNCIYKSELYLLEQITNLVLVEKLELFVELLEKRWLEYCQVSDSLLISLTLLKWLYFYEKNISNFHITSSGLLNCSLNSNQFDPYREIFCSSYFQIAIRIIKFLPLQYLVEIFFNSFQNVSYFKHQFTPSKIQFNINCFMTSSPFQYLIQDQAEGQKLLKQLKQSMQLKIDQKQKFLCKERMRYFSLQTQKLNQMNEIYQKQMAVQKAKKILQVLTLRLQQTKTQLKSQKVNRFIDQRLK